MNTNQMLDFIKPYFKEPIFEEWKPDEYYMKHIFKDTKARIRKLNVTKEKEDERLRVNYNDEMNRYTAVIARIKKFGNLPAAIRDLFFHTIEWNVNEGIRVRKELATLEKKVKAYDECCIWRSVLLDWRKSHIYKYFEVRYVGDESHWFVKDENRKDLMYHYGCLKHVKDVDSFIWTMQDYIKVRDAAKNFPSEYDSIVCTTDSLINIMDTMVKLLGGMPEWCEHEASWGLKGYYNGIIGRGSKRVSMKSFLAGGHNIQRLHIRCRCTLLKEAA